MAVKWLTKKIKSLFPFVHLNLSRKIYKGICSCGKTYIGETIPVEEHWSEHNSADKKSKPAKKHLADNEEHSLL